jgi:hypothetical protein
MDALIRTAPFTDLAHRQNQPTLRRMIANAHLDFLVGIPTCRASNEHTTAGRHNGGRRHACAVARLAEAY